MATAAQAAVQQVLLGHDDAARLAAPPPAPRRRRSGLTVCMSSTRAWMPLPGQLLGRLQGRGDHQAVGDDRQVLAVAELDRLAELEGAAVVVDDRHVGPAGAQVGRRLDRGQRLRRPCVIDGSSAGTTTVKFGSEQARPTSSMPICDGPSSPMLMPAWVPTTFTSRHGKATDMRSWS